MRPGFEGEGTASSGKIPRQPRPQMRDQAEVRNERSKRQVVSPSEISVIDGSIGVRVRPRPLLRIPTPQLRWTKTLDDFVVTGIGSMHNP